MHCEKKDDERYAHDGGDLYVPLGHQADPFQARFGQTCPPSRLNTGHVLYRGQVYHNGTRATVAGLPLVEYDKGGADRSRCASRCYAAQSRSSAIQRSLNWLSRLASLCVSESPHSFIVTFCAASGLGCWPMRPVLACDAARKSSRVGESNSQSHGRRCRNLP